MGVKGYGAIPILCPFAKQKTAFNLSRFQLILGGDSGVYLFNMTKEIDEVAGTHEIAFAFNSPAEKGGGGAFFIHPDAVQEICRHGDFQVCLPWARAIENFQWWLATIEQHFGGRLRENETDDQIAVGEGCNLFWLRGNPVKDMM
jgi:hypothetical protein